MCIRHMCVRHILSKRKGDIRDYPERITQEIKTFCTGDAHGKKRKGLE